MTNTSAESKSKGSLREIRAESSLTAKVRESIREAIIDGTLEPGTLHSVQSLADIFKVSKTPVREALIDLAGADMVEFERNRGFRVLETSVHDLEEILIMRILLEVPATHRAAGRIDAEGLDNLKRELEAMADAAENGDEPTMMQHDRRFHELINTASGNSRLTEYVDSLRDLILTRGVSTVDNTRSLSEIVAEHEVILSALASGDADAAAAEMKRHLVNTASLLLQQEGGRSTSLGLGWDGLVAGEIDEI